MAIQLNVFLIWDQFKRKIPHFFVLYLSGTALFKNQQCHKNLKQKKNSFYIRPLRPEQKKRDKIESSHSLLSTFASENHLGWIDSFQSAIHLIDLTLLFTNHIHLIYMNKLNLALNTKPKHYCIVWNEPPEALASMSMHSKRNTCLNQTGDISTLGGSSLKLVDKFTYLGSSVSSIEKYIDTRLAKAWTTIVLELWGM